MWSTGFGQSGYVQSQFQMTDRRNQTLGKQWLQSHTDQPLKEVLWPWILSPLFISKPLLKHGIIISYWCRVRGGGVRVVWRCSHHSKQESAVVSDWLCVQPTDVSATSTRKSIKIKTVACQKAFYYSLNWGVFYWLINWSVRPQRL